MIDLHCHILPGLDDGAGSLAESLEMAGVAQADGIRTIVATPHLFRGNIPSAELALIEGARRRLSDALEKNSLAVRIAAGAEVHISHNLLAEIRAHRGSLVIQESAYMFIEFPSDHIYPGIQNLFFEIMSEGIIPIIAHPERNAVFARDPGLLYDLVRMGALAQSNSGSLTGFYGKEAAEAARRFLEWRLVHFLASDGHNSDSRPPRLSEAVRKAEEIVGRDGARALVEDNPQAVLEDRDIVSWPTPVDPRKFKKSVSFRIPEFLKRSR